jgi:hypothetical protein
MRSCELNPNTQSVRYTLVGRRVRKSLDLSQIGRDGFTAAVSTAHLRYLVEEGRTQLRPRLRRFSVPPNTPRRQ